VLSRSEEEPDGPVVPKTVEEVFVHTGRILHLHVGGEVIRTTPEHPFYAAGRGWTAAGRLSSSDRLRTLSKGWVKVADVYDTGESERVYNLRVADFHTYFVGDEAWGFALWAHNSCFIYNGLNGDNLEGVINRYFPEGSTRDRINLDPAHPNETVRVKASGAGIDTAATSVCRC
jgi:hypothetical protein